MSQQQRQQESETDEIQLEQVIIQLEQGEYQEVIRQLEVYMIQRSNSSSSIDTRVYQMKAQCHYNLSEYQKCIEQCDNVLNSSIQGEYYEQNPIILQTVIQLYILRIDSYIHTKQQQELVLRDIGNLNRIVNKVKQQQNIQKLLEETINKIKQLQIQLGVVLYDNNTQQQQQQYSVEREQEAKYFMDLMDENEEQGYMTTEGFPVHIVSNKWFSKWMQYTKFNKVIASRKQQQQVYNQENEFDDSESNNNSNSEYPGEINSEDILLHEQKLLIDPSPVKAYTNYIIKPDLQQNEDFILLPKKPWKLLYNKYKGQELTRFIVSVNDDTNQTMIEIWLQKINVLIIPALNTNIQQLTNNTLDTYMSCVYISKKETVKELKDKLNRIYKLTANDKQIKLINTNNCKLWKIDPRANYQQLLQQIQTGDTNITLKGIELANTTILEEADIAETDVTIIEYKLNGKWLFTAETHEEKVKIQCAHCGKIDHDLYICECYIVYYCDKQCQKQHRNDHKGVCLRQKREKSQSIDIKKTLEIEDIGRFGDQSNHGLTGLQNLGNTCFMNSSLQCLGSVWELTEYFVTNEFVRDLNIRNALGSGGQLASAYADLVKQLYCGDESYMSPWHFKKIISKRASQFSGFQQHDSQELLAFLLDGLHEDLNRVKNQPFVELEDSENRPDNVVAQEQWDHHLRRNQSIIVDLMHGQFKSTLICPDCQKVSITFDPFNVLSVPIPNSKPIRLTLYLILRDTRITPRKIMIECLVNTKIHQIKEYIADSTDIPKQNLVFVLIKAHEILDIPSDTMDAQFIDNHDGVPFIFQLIDYRVDPTGTQLLQSKLNNNNTHDDLTKTFILIKFSINIPFKKNEVEKITFTRLLYIHKNVSLDEFELLIYKYMRSYIHNYILSTSNHQLLSVINIDSNDDSIIKQEYQQLFNQQNEQSDPSTNNEFLYSIFISSPDSIEMFSNNNNKKKNGQHLTLQQKLLSVCSNINNIEIGLILSQHLKHKLMKFNKCTEEQNILKLNQSLNSSQQNNISIYNCIEEFTKQEKLEKGNEWYCNKCKNHKLATKKMEIYKLPPILIIHLKRFRTQHRSSEIGFSYGGRTQKIDVQINFPIDNLDLTSYTIQHTHTDNNSNNSVVYDLFAVSNYYGGLGGGHYTATCKNYRDHKWYDYNDTSVQSASKNDIQSNAAYVLFYKKRNWVFKS